MNSATVKKDVVYSISFAHMLNDWYMNIIPILTPFLIAAGFGIGEVSFAISAFTITSSLSQPLIGYMVDRKNQSWMIYVGTAWLAILLSCIGLTHSSTMIEGAGQALRGSFLVNPDGVIKAYEIHDTPIGRNVEELLRKLEAAQFVAEHGDQVCPARWKPGSATLKPGLDLVGKI